MSCYEGEFTELDNDLITLWSQWCLLIEKVNGFANEELTDKVDKVFCKIEKLAELGHPEACTEFVKYCKINSNPKICKIIDNFSEDNYLNLIAKFRKAQVINNGLQEDNRLSLVHKTMDRMSFADRLGGNVYHVSKIYAGMSREKIDALEETKYIYKAIDDIKKRLKESYNVLLMQKLFFTIGKLPYYSDKEWSSAIKGLQDLHNTIKAMYISNKNDPKVAIEFALSLDFMGDYKNSNKIYEKLAKRPLSKTLTDYIENESEK